MTSTATSRNAVRPLKAIVTKDGDGMENGWLTEEEWRRVEGHHYEVSSWGRVRKTKPHKNFLVGYILKPNISSTGYPVVALSKDAKYRYVAIHVLVCEAFHGKKPTPAHQVAHWDGTRSNNRVDNLRWATPTENQLDRHRHGTISLQRGEEHHEALLNEQLVRDMRLERMAGATYKFIAKRRGIHASTAQNAIRGITWSHILEPAGCPA